MAMSRQEIKRRYREKMRRDPERMARQREYQRGYQREYQRNLRLRDGDARLGTVLRKHVYQKRAYSAQKGWHCTLTAQRLLDLWYAQGGKCAVTGLPLHVPTEHDPWAPTTLSVDRLDNSVGYTDDNVRLVCLQYNFARNEFSDESVLQMARALVARHDAPLSDSSV